MRNLFLILSDQRHQYPAKKLGVHIVHSIPKDAMTSTAEPYLTSHPDENGFFGKFGGSFIPPSLQKEMDEIKDRWLELRDTPEFVAELNAIRKNYQGRPTPLQYAKRLSESVGGGGEKGVEIYLKREDLNHTGAHKLNHCVGDYA